MLPAGPLGRVATEAAILLRGKHKPTYEPHLDDGDFVIVINAGQVKVTGHKAEQNKYYTHSGYPGGLRTRTYTEQFNRFPERVIEKAVWGMLPGGSLGEAMFKHLKVYRGAHHPHQSQITGSERAQAARAEALQASPLRAQRAPAPPSHQRRSQSRIAHPRAALAAAPPPPHPKPRRGKAAPKKRRRRHRRAAEAIEAKADLVTTTGITQPEAAIAGGPPPRPPKPPRRKGRAHARARRKGTSADPTHPPKRSPPARRAPPKTEE